MRASFCSTQTSDEELIPASRNGSCNCGWRQHCLPGKQDSCDFTTILVAIFTLFRLKISMQVLLSASEHGKNSLQTVNHLWGCVQWEKNYFFLNILEFFTIMIFGAKSWSLMMVFFIKSIVSVENPPGFRQVIVNGYAFFTCRHSASSPS